ncbi:MAG: hypothetical protein ACTH58_01265 [Marinomonas foliarum]|uniref:hypothetical protein n=1 Tax=Marinomonas foliarum TaxID=491950 RepID=UPI003F947409
MASYGEKTIREVSELEGLLRQSVIDGYSQDELRAHVSNAAAKLELFLKRDVFPLKSNRANFVEFIDELKKHIANQSLIDNLHDLRKLYNKAKHDPNYTVEVSDAIKAVSSSIPTLVEICRLSLGQTNSPIRAAATRIFWICGWDHYIHGETEVAVFLPSKYDGFLGAKSLDCVNIVGLKWDSFKNELPLFGKVHPYADWIPKGQTDFWFSEGDCLTPLVFEGEYKALLSCLAKYENEAQGRLPGLNRTDSSQSLYQSCVLATIDIAVSSPMNLRSQSSAIVNLVNSQYAVPASENQRVENFVNQILDLVEEIPSASISALTGPFWVKPEELQSTDTYALDERIHTAVDKKNRLLLGVM